MVRLSPPLVHPQAILTYFVPPRICGVHDSPDSTSAYLSAYKLFVGNTQLYENMCCAGNYGIFLVWAVKTSSLMYPSQTTWFINLRGKSVYANIGVDLRNFRDFHLPLKCILPATFCALILNDILK